MEQDTLNTGLMNISVASKLSELALREPEKVYKTLVEAEKFIEELKDKARNAVLARHIGPESKFQIDAGDSIVQSVRLRPKMITARVAAVLTKHDIDVALVLFKKVTFDELPTARETLDKMLADGKITQLEYNSMFATPTYQVSVKPKSAQNIIEHGNADNGPTY